MLSLRQEALQFVNNVPDNLLSALVEHLNNFKLPSTNTDIETKTKTVSKNTFTDEEIRNLAYATNIEVDPKKEKAFKELEEWRIQNRHLLDPNTDYKQVWLEAIDEKYGFTDRR